MNIRTIILSVFLAGVLLSGWQAQAVEPAPKSSQPKLVPRPLPGMPPSVPQSEPAIFKKPFIVTGSANAQGGNESLRSDKARILVIHRGSGAVVLPTTESAATAIPETVAVPQQEARPPLRPGQIRVLTKAEADLQQAPQPRP